MSASRKRSRTAATTPVTEPAPPKIALTGGVAMPEKQVEHWRQGKLLDCTITAGGHDFEAHRLVLTSGSDFFDGAFTSGLAESGSAHVTLPEVPASAFEAVLSFLYTGEAMVAEAELLPLLQAAAYLQVSPLVDAVAARLEARLTPVNCLETWALAETHAHARLSTAAKEAALKAFNSMAESEAWLSAPHARVQELLTDERLTTAAEEAVHSAVVHWATAQRPPPTDAALLPLFRAVRYPLVAKAFFEARVLTEPLLRGTLGFDVLGSSFASLAYGTRVARRPGFGPSRPALTWSTVHKAIDIDVTGSGKVATSTASSGQAVRSAEPLPSTGRHLVELVYARVDREAGDALGTCYMTGVVSAAAAQRDFNSGVNYRRVLATMSDDFWGVDDCGIPGPYSGIRRGDGALEAVPDEAKIGVTDGERAVRVFRQGAVFSQGDRVGLLVDMDARTLTFLRNGTPIHASLVFHNLPDQVYVAATPADEGSSVRFVA